MVSLSGSGLCYMLHVHVCSLVPSFHSPAFYRTVHKVSTNFLYMVRYKSWGVETGNEAMVKSILT